MNKTAIKNFAIWARNKLIADVSYDARLIGITEDGIAKPLPQSFGGTQFFDIGTAEPYSISGEAVRQRDKLIEVIQQKEKDTDYKTAYHYVIEEVAYTWFNRLIAIRFMEVNDYLPSHIRVLSSESGKLEPDLVTTPFDAELPFTAEEEARIFQLKQDNKLDEAFRILFLKQCNALNEILPALFEKTKNYTELLLSLSVIDQDGVVYHLIHDIPEDDFNIERGGQVEIIGWLYQYYNTEPKAAAFAKNGKITKEEIPAVTQLFTPDWIVRYMVENSLGRLWVEGHPDCDLKENWKYYLEEAQQEPEVQAKLSEIRKEYAALNPEDIKLIDPCMGSGHILVYAFDVLMQIYESAGYSQRDAAKSILENNIYGLDIDDRAYQLAYFAVMMKARQYNRRILNGENSCHVYAIQESNSINRAHLKYFGAGMDDIEKNAAKMQLEGLLDTLTDAKEYGSILNVESYNWDLLRRFVAAEDTAGQISMDSVGVEDTAEQLNRLVDIGETMARKYWVTITNPPYAAISNLSPKVNDFVKANYPDSKVDLFAVFIERCGLMTRVSGYQAMITQHAWMFLASYENLRYTKERTVVIISDAMRYEVGQELFARMQDDPKCTAKLSVQLSVLPSYTRLGMAALLPHKTLEMTDDFQVLADGILCDNLAGRQQVLQSYNPDSVCVQFDDIKNLKVAELRDVLTKRQIIYVYHNQIDARGDKANTEDEVFNACEEAVQEIVDLIHRISVSGNTYHFIVTADHGFIYKRDKLTESDKISGKSADKAFVNRRFIVSKAALGDDGIDHMSMGRILGNEDSKMVSYPVSSNVFKVAGGGANYVHGGSSPQEMLVPVLEFKMERGHMETKNAEIALVSIVHKITNLITSMDFIQSDAVSDTVKAAKYRIFFLSEDNEKISNENSYVADSREENAQKRIFRMRFTFKNKKYDKDKQYYLVVYDEESGLEQWRQPVIMDIAFADDFGFGF